MGNNETTESIATTIVGEAIKAAKDSPHLKEAGGKLAKSALVVTTTINNALLPLAAINFGFQKAREYFEKHFANDMEEKLAGIPPEKIIEPKASVAGPALNGLAFAHDEPALKDMFLNLLSKSMDSGYAEKAHPAYVEVIKQMSSFDAELATTLLRQQNWEIVEFRLENTDGSYGVIYKNVLPNRGTTQRFSEDPSTQHALDNLKRLGLIQITYSIWSKDDPAYKWADDHSYYKKLEAAAEAATKSPLIGKGLVLVSDLGLQFGEIVGLWRVGLVTSNFKPQHHEHENYLAKI